MMNLDLILQKSEFSDEELRFLLGLSDPEDCKKLQKAAFDLTEKCLGNKIVLCGLIEISNICTANCRYCGIRKDNHFVDRYTLEKEVIINSALIAFKKDMDLLAYKLVNDAIQNGLNSSLKSSLRFMKKRFALNFQMVWAFS